MIDQAIVTLPITDVIHRDDAIRIATLMEVQEQIKALGDQYRATGIAMAKSTIDLLLASERLAFSIKNLALAQRSGYAIDGIAEIKLGTSRAGEVFLQLILHDPQMSLEPMETPE